MASADVHLQKAPSRCSPPVFTGHCIGNDLPCRPCGALLNPRFCAAIYFPLRSFFFEEVEPDIAVYDLFATTPLLIGQ